VRYSKTLRHRVGFGSGLLLALAAQAPLTVMAATSGATTLTAPVPGAVTSVATTVPAVVSTPTATLPGVVSTPTIPSVVTTPPTTLPGLVSTPIPGPPGVVTNLPTAPVLSAGDWVSSGWAISMPGAHPAATVQLTHVLATIPLSCQVVGRHPDRTDLVLKMPDASQTFAADDNGVYPTSSTAAAVGYQVSGGVGDLCQGGVLTSQGNPTYTATLVSADTTDPFALQFHSVDARINPIAGGGTSQVNPNTPCASRTLNATGVAQCAAPWSAPTTSFATAAAATAGGGTGTGSGGTGSPPGNPVTIPLPVPAVGPGTVGGVVTGVGAVHGGTGIASARRLTRTGRAANDAAVTGTKAGGDATTGTGTGSAPSATQPGAVSGVTAPPSSVVVPGPAPSAVPRPALLPVPAIDSVTTGVGGSVPWMWFLLLLALDLGLIVVIAVRRRSTQRERLRRQ
jgi:hypothetical protein